MVVALGTPYGSTKMGPGYYYLGPENVAGTEALKERDVLHDLELLQVLLC